MYEEMSRGKLEHDDVLLVKTGTIGKTKYVDTIPESRAAVNQHVFLLKPSEKLRGRLVAYQLRSPWVQNQLDLYIRGSVQAFLRSTFANEVQLIIPPDEIQEKLLRYLDNSTDHINYLIDKNQRLVNLLKEKRQVVIEESVTKGIDCQEFSSNDRLTVLGEHPENWEVRRAKTIFYRRDDRGYDELPLLEVSLNHGVRLREENEDRNAWTASDLEDMKRVAVDDLVFNKMRLWQGAIGRSDYEGLVSPDYTVLKPRLEANPIYYEHLLRTRAYKTEVNRRSYGVVDDRNRIYWKQFGDMPLLHPSPEEQAEIVEHINEETKKIDELREKVNNAIELLDEKRQALITAAVTGQIDVADWDPSEQEAPA